MSPLYTGRNKRGPLHKGSSSSTSSERLEGIAVVFVVQQKPFNHKGDHGIIVMVFPVIDPTFMLSGGAVDGRKVFLTADLLSEHLEAPLFDFRFKLFK